MSDKYAIFLNDRMIHSDLMEKAESALLKKLEMSSGNERHLERLADLYRQQGKLKEAAQIYENLARAMPQSARARYLAELFNNRIPQAGYSEEGISPAPFYVKENFLPQSLHDALFRIATESETQFKASHLVYPMKDGGMESIFSPEKRMSREIPLPQNLKKLFLARVKRLLPTIRRSLSFDKYKIRDYTTLLVHHGDGDFLFEHRDFFEVRWITLVYYFCGSERTFTGGSTLLYDTDTQKGIFSQSSFTQFPFEDNRLLAFPGNYYHGVLPIHCKDNRFECGRFSIVLWLKP